MSDLIRSMTVQRGLDPRSFTVYAFGGGAGAHAGLYTQGLGISRFVVPLRDAASIWSAVGLATADLLDVHEQPILLHDPFDADALTEAFDLLESRVREELGDPGAAVEEVRLERYARCKYGLQVYEVQAPVPDGVLDATGAQAVASAFEEVYARRFGEGAGYRQAGIILTGIGLRVHGRVRKPGLRRRSARSRGAARRGQRRRARRVLGRAGLAQSRRPCGAARSSYPGTPSTARLSSSCPTRRSWFAPTPDSRSMPSATPWSPAAAGGSTNGGAR